MTGTPAALSWALVVATYRRHDVLRRCLRQAVGQTRPPRQIIVIDASPDWEQQRSRLLSAFEQEGGDIQWLYLPAEVASLPAQRNQGIDRAEADVVFLIDDDSLMAPDCAEQVMRVYEADAAGRCVGVCATLMPDPPDERGANEGDRSSDAAGAKAAGRGAGRKGTLGRFKKRVRGWFGMEDFLEPYEPFDPPTLPEALRVLGAHPVKSFHGCRMTFRRDAVAAVRFDAALVRYAYLEDVDLCYRVRRRGTLVVAPGARLCHLEASSGRLPLEVSTTLGLTNAAFLHRRHAGWDPGLRRYRSKAWRRSLFMLARDLRDGHWRLPQVRGCLRAIPVIRRLAELPAEELVPWYQRYQRQLIEPDAEGGASGSPGASEAAGAGVEAP